MQIDIPQEVYDKLSARAAAGGFGDVVQVIAALVADETVDPRGALSAAELKASAAECRQASAAIRAGQGLDAREALLKLGQELGFQLRQ